MAVKTSTIVCVTAAATVLGLAGCGSDTATEASSSSVTSSTASATSSTPPTSTAAPTSAPPAATGALTITDYLKSINVTETPVRVGDPGAPKIDFPVAPGWQQAIDVPGKPYWAIMFDQATNPADPPIIQAVLTKLSADVPVDKIYEYAAGELKNLPGYQAMGDGGRGELGGIEAHQDAGMYDDKGTQKLVAQKTMLIASPTGPFLLRVRATGSQDDAQALVAATAQLDDNTVITP